ncbi:prolipoprotein diacylglyceryl transferase [Luminiphilus syltensis NOR5-1B]|uniref:Phosphatidylglycerol--prolipoprotein diacylglyceryl transferase n=1 Tax=Luminiphilus syltensis NOR5-1B TaxID=565045 RepID=B8KU42_9GAMM|nr:prolipoprotein diacylglyceryl transferase [Luminiphilus syltensis]EED36766.1 prolipoprotein diacylglyceryl transferase [Luminiphilus syltensis NOR5-1B]
MISYPQIDPVAFSIGPYLQVHWYGLTYLAGLGFAWWLATRRCRRPDSPLRRELVDDLIFFAAVGIVLGGRVGYALFYGLDQLSQDLSWLVRVWEGGMSFHGGLLGVVAATVFFARKHRVAVGDIADFVAPLAPVGLGLGRLGNFIGQELWGRPTDVPWAMVFPRDPLGLARHPSQLYQFAFEGCLLFIIVAGFSRRPRPRWSVSGVFLVGYGVLRFIVEFFRAPDSHLGFVAFGWMTRGQVLCVPMVVIGLALIGFAYRARPSGHPNAINR